MDSLVDSNCFFTLTPTLSQRERVSGSLSLWERIGVRVKFLEGTKDFNGTK